VSRGARVALVVVLALCCAVLGAIGAAALHWNVVQPSDDELRSAAGGVPLDGFHDVGDRVISGAWAPELARGEVVWDAVVDRVVTVGDLAADLRADGWTVSIRTPWPDRGSIHGERGQFYVTVHLLPGDQGGTHASVSVGRGLVNPSLATTVWLGIAAGAAIGVCVGLVLARGHCRSHPRRPWIPSAVRYGAPSPRTTE